MFIPLWTAKAGAGCTVTALALAARLVETSESPVLLVDLGGDQPAAAGLAAPPDGVTDWLAAAECLDDALGRLEVDITAMLSLLPLGNATRWEPRRVDTLLQLLDDDPRPIVVDVGTVDRRSCSALGALRSVLATADGSLMVTRACYLSLRRAAAMGVGSSSVVLLREARRSLDRYDIARVLDAPVVAEIDVDAGISRLVDAGLLATRVPRQLARQLDALTEALT